MASSVIITPTQGAAPLFTNTGVGDPSTGTGYFATAFRRALGLSMEPGVRSAASFRVVEHAAGANMQVDVTQDVGALIRPQSRPDELYDIPAHSVTITLDVPAADATNPTVHRVLLIVEDDELDASGLAQARCYLEAGTPTAGATLSNASGAPSVPDNAMHIGYVLVPATATSVTSANISTYRQLAYSKGTTVGESKDLHHDSPDDGWLVEDGRTLPFIGYDRLAAKLGKSADFAIPDTQGRVLVAKGTNADVDNIGDNEGVSVGSRTPKHTHAIPSHSHVVDAHTHTLPFSGNESSIPVIVTPQFSSGSLVSGSPHGHGFSAPSGATAPGTNGVALATDTKSPAFQVVRRAIFTGTVV